MAPKIGILLGQLGTPDAPTTSAVRRYLAEFLWDRRVVDLHRVLWWLILHGIVLRTRPSMSAALYSNVWTEDGSPLLHFTMRQARGLERGLAARGADVRAEVAMRYGSPSTPEAIQRLVDWGAERLLLFPMYPQYSAPTTASTCDAVFAEMSRRRVVPALRVVPPYYDHPAYIDALADSARETLASIDPPPDRVLLSFHGIPERYARMGDPYPSHCRATADALVATMGWTDDDYLLTFQSRFGREPWLQPYTAETLMELGSRGIKRIVAMCPGFTADCLETIDEIGNLGREQFESGGGESLVRVPCLNDRPRWIEAMTAIAASELEGWL